ncbi:polyol transporter 5-like [Eucalyptus grandis]|uniref:polyol transporter 5-like n=1 Tax=Eucalyptus grandis TaxID=71139 RepID=UPI00192EF0A9|nr:polyol transporter 5-like [Eucalyptus grandis]
MPESLKWLIMRGHLGFAKPIFTKTSKYEEEAALRLAQIKKDASIPKECDHDIVDTHQNMGMCPTSSRPSKRLIVSLMVDLLKILYVIFTTYFINQLGQRRLLLSSIGGVVILLVSFKACLGFIEASNMRPLWAVVTCLVTRIGYVISFSIGLAPIAAVYCSKIFPTRLCA